MQNHGVLNSEVSYFFSIIFHISRKNISSSMGLILIKLNSRIVSKIPLSSKDLSTALAFHITKAMQVVMIYKNKNIMLTTFQIMASGLESFNNSQKFVIISFILSFYLNYISREEGFPMPLAKVVKSHLAIDFINSIARYINFDINITIQIKIIKD